MARMPSNHVMPTGEVLKKLFGFGYFGNKTWSQVKNIKGPALTQAIREYQRFHGLEPDGLVDVRTAHVLERRRCGLPDFNFKSGDTACKWPHREITYFADIKLPGINDEQAKQAYDIAFSQWAAVCNIEPKRAEQHNEANIYARSGKGKKHGLDDRGGTLAWSELPCDVTENIQLDQMFDEAEEWSFNMAVAVICHELGHALGLPHLAKGNLMAPYYDPNVTAPQEGDVREIVDLYGKRKTPYSLIKDASIHLGGTILINGKPYILVPKT
jgi:Matrixin/Putative peptidoglycan binding domain